MQMESIIIMPPKPVAIVPEKILPANPEAVRHYAQTVESLGYWAVTCKDHVILGKQPDGNNGYTNEHAFLEPMTLFSFMAGVTERIKMISGVLVLPQRQTALVAKQAQMTSDLTGGRLILGVGVGSNRTEFAAMGADMHGRGKRLENQIHAMKKLWIRPYNSFSLDREHVVESGINPQPKHSIPIWIGGWALPVLDRTARLADGWAPMGHPSDTKPLLPTIHGLLEKYGRSPDSLDIFGAFATSRRGTQTPDSLEQRVKDLEQWVDLGATAVAYGAQDTTIPQTEALDKHLDDLAAHMELFKRVTGYQPEQ
jgi:probable F420-dependent oxidoreductase